MWTRARHTPKLPWGCRTREAALPVGLFPNEGQAAEPPSSDHWFVLYLSPGVQELMLNTHPGWQGSHRSLFPADAS